MFTTRSVLFSFFTFNTSRLVLVLGAGLVSGSLGILIPISLGKYYDLTLGYRSYRAGLLDIFPASWTDTISNFFVFFSVLILVRLGAEFIERFLTGLIGESFIFHIRKLLFTQQMRIPLCVYDERGIGRYLLRWSGDLKSLQRLITHGMIRFARDLIFILCMLLALYQIYPVLCALLAVVLGLSILGIRMLNYYLFDASVKVRNRKSGLLGFINQRLRAIGTVQALNREPVEYEKFEKKAGRILAAGKSYHQIYATIYTFASGAIFLLFFCLMYWGVWAKEHTREIFDPSAILIAFLLLISLAPVLRRIFRVPVYWEMARISMRKLLIVLNLGEEVEQEKNLFALQQGEITISLDEVPKVHLPGRTTRFLYERDASKREKIVQQLLGLYPLEQGGIQIDGQVLMGLNKKSFRRKIAVVSNQLPLLGRSVFEGISYSRKAEKRKAAQTLLDHFQEGIDREKKLTLKTPMGELGKLLLAEQKKLCMVLRALLTDKPILILQNPFEGLLPQARETLVQYLNNQQGKKTILILGARNEPGLFVDKEIPHTA